MPGLKGILLAAVTSIVLVTAASESASAAAIAIGVPAPATFATALGTSGYVETTGGRVEVTALGSWALRIHGSDGGRLRSTGTGTCTSGSAVLSNPLRVWASGSQVTSPGSDQDPIVLSEKPQLLASGTVGGLVALAVPVTVTYRYVPSPQDQLPAGCPYSMTATIDISA